MSESLSRDALIEQAKRLGQARGSERFDQECRPDTGDVEWCVEHDRAQLLCVSDAASVASVDAVLCAVADDLEAMHCDITKEQTVYSSGWLYNMSVNLAYLDGIEAAEQRVRGLLGKDKTNE